MSIVDKIQNSIDNREYSCGTFLDLSKAFDTVNHEILISKMEHYGIRGVANDWFASYLSGRSQITVCGDCIGHSDNIAFRAIAFRKMVFFFRKEGKKHVQRNSVLPFY